MDRLQSWLATNVCPLCSVNGVEVLHYGGGDRGYGLGPGPRYPQTRPRRESLRCVSGLLSAPTPGVNDSSILTGQDGFPGCQPPAWVDVLEEASVDFA